MAVGEVADAHVDADDAVGILFVGFSASSKGVGVETMVDVVAKGGFGAGAVDANCATDGFKVLLLECFEPGETSSHSLSWNQGYVFVVESSQTGTPV